MKISLRIPAGASGQSLAAESRVRLARLLRRHADRRAQRHAVRDVGRLAAQSGAYLKRNREDEA